MKQKRITKNVHTEFIFVNLSQDLIIFCLSVCLRFKENKKLMVHDNVSKTVLINVPKNEHSLCTKTSIATFLSITMTDGF